MNVNFQKSLSKIRECIAFAGSGKTNRFSLPASGKRKLSQKAFDRVMHKWEEQAAKYDALLKKRENRGK